MTITTKQISEGKITQTVFIPLARAIELDKAAKRLGISRNRFINICIDFALKNEDKKMMSSSSSVGGKVSSQPHPAATEAVVEATIDTTNTKEVAAL